MLITSQYASVPLGSATPAARSAEHFDLCCPHRNLLGPPIPRVSSKAGRLSCLAGFLFLYFFVLKPLAGVCRSSAASRPRDSSPIAMVAPGCVLQRLGSRHHALLELLAHQAGWRGFSVGPAARATGSYWHELGEEPLQYMTMGALVERTAHRHGDREAVVSVQEGVRLTYRQLLDQADCMAAGMRSLGLRHGDRVAIWSPNSWRWVVTKVAVARAGLISVDMNPMYREQEALHCLSLARVAAVVMADKHGDQRYHDLLTNLAPELPASTPGNLRAAALPDLKVVITMADSAPKGSIAFPDVLSSASHEDVQAVRDEGRTIDPDSGSYIQFSSGTTGKPKAILVSHRGVVNNGYFIGKRLGFHEKHHTVCMQMPLFHAFGSVVATSSILNHGATMVLPGASYSPRAALAAAHSEQCTVMTGTPTMYVDLVRAVEERRSEAAIDTLELAITGGAPITPKLVRDTKAVLGLKRLCSVYGLSETTAVVFQGTSNDTMDQVAETVGRICDHLEVKVVDANNNLVPFGTPGELLVRGYLTMNEYFQNEAATRKTLVNGWLRTGDKFVLQADGYGRIVGRIKDMIIRGGENIYPKEVEDVLTTHPDVREAEVVGVPDERLGEELCACLRLRDGAHISALDLRTFLKGKMASYKVPRYCVVLTEFPKTLSGKIQKFKLRENCVRLLSENKLDDSRAQR